jgi:hypothetical protein
LAEAQILVEKLRTLELMAQVNRYNADIYWRIRAEIINIKRELLDIARRPIFIFGLTREQIEASFRDFTRTIADPRFWLRWRLGGQMLPEMALRAAIWAQQPGMAAIPVFDPRLIAMLGLPQILAAFPMFRWWGLLEAVTGRRMPFDVRTLIQAAGMGLLADIFNVPQPLMGMPPLSYFFNLMPQIQNFLARFGMLPDIFMRPLSPFMPFRTGAPELSPASNRPTWRVNAGLPSLAVSSPATSPHNQLHPVQHGNLTWVLFAENRRNLKVFVVGCGGRTHWWHDNYPARGVPRPTSLCGVPPSRGKGYCSLKGRVYRWRAVPDTPTSVLVAVLLPSACGLRLQVPVMMGNRPIGTLNLNPAALQEWA